MIAFPDLETEMAEKKTKNAQESEGLALGLAWYKPEQWGRLLEIAADAEELEKTYAEWLAIANKALRDLEAQFVFPEKVEVDVEELLAWCRERKRPVDGAARSEYVAWLLREREQREGKGVVFSPTSIDGLVE